MASKKNTEAPAAKIARNPSDASARSMYEAVVAQEGSVGGKPARIALYGTKYAALEVGGDGAWEVHHDTAFGGVRAIESLKGGLDEVLVLGGDSREIQLTAGNVAAVQVEAEQPVVATVAEPIAEAFGLVGSPVVEIVAAPTVAAEPVLATLDEVRAAFEAETRGACRASVLRALRVRAGEIALGLPAGGKAAKAKAERPARGKLSGFDAMFMAALTAATPSPDGSIHLSCDDLESDGAPASATRIYSFWKGGAGSALAATAGFVSGLRKLNGKQVIALTPNA